MESTLNKPAWQVASKVELVYKSKVKNSERPLITSPSDAKTILLLAWNEEKLTSWNSSWSCC